MILDSDSGTLWDGSGRVFDAATRQWSPAAGATRGDDVSRADAVRWLQRDSGTPCRVPVGVIGPRDATVEQVALAERLGAGLADIGVVVICGGREGVMEAVCRGVAGAGGLSIGLLPDESWQAANAHVSIPIATGIGVARNAIVARAALCLVAVGGGHGTTSEMAFGLQFEKPVFGLAGAPDLPGATALDDADAACHAVAGVILNLDR